ncbi:hypothetical protein TrST_g5728 [Triparma strigata]|uniref:Uncharacterized protein n=1 Tax=Triparma strigata TaxID=1606541 RepID=A0A9W7AZ17_9STRA|nr:hypothetical protein TrST_g5728 [Triparma strigata]
MASLAATLHPSEHAASFLQHHQRVHNIPLHTPPLPVIQTNVCSKFRGSSRATNSNNGTIVQTVVSSNPVDSLSTSGGILLFHLTSRPAFVTSDGDKIPLAKHIRQRTQALESAISEYLTRDSFITLKSESLTVSAVVLSDSGALTETTLMSVLAALKSTPDIVVDWTKAPFLVEFCCLRLSKEGEGVKPVEGYFRGEQGDWGVDSYWVNPTCVEENLATSPPSPSVSDGKCVTGNGLATFCTNRKGDLLGMTMTGKVEKGIVKELLKIVEQRRDELWKVIEAI